MAEWMLLLSQKLLKVSNICSQTCGKTLTPLVSCIVNDAVVQPMPSMQQNAAITFYAFQLFERLSFIDETIKMINSKIVHGFFLLITVET